MASAELGLRRITVFRVTTSEPFFKTIQRRGEPLRSTSPKARRNHATSLGTSSRDRGGISTRPILEAAIFRSTDSEVSTTVARNNRRKCNSYSVKFLSRTLPSKIADSIFRRDILHIANRIESISDLGIHHENLDSAQFRSYFLSISNYLDHVATLEGRRNSAHNEASSLVENIESRHGKSSR